MRWLINHHTRVTSAWGQMLTLLWQTQSWFVTMPLVLTVISGLASSAQIRLTSSIIGGVLQVARAGHTRRNKCTKEEGGICEESVIYFQE